MVVSSDGMKPFPVPSWHCKQVFYPNIFSTLSNTPSKPNIFSTLSNTTLQT